MKRLHVHVAVPDLSGAIRFYSQLFGSGPTVQETDYAKWMLDDPRVNFAVSARGKEAGIEHLGIQVESDAELGDMRQRLQTIDGRARAETAETCCYAVSEKSWIVDPVGMPWEVFHTLARSKVFGGAPSAAAGSAHGCCGPESTTEPDKGGAERRGCC